MAIGGSRRRTTVRVVAAVAGSIAVAAAVARRRAPAPAPADAPPPPPLPRRRGDTGEIPATPGPATIEVAPGAVAGAPATNGHAPPAVTDGDPDARFEAAAHLLADLTTPADGPRRAAATPATVPAEPPRPTVELQPRPEARSEAGPVTLPPIPPDPRVADRNRADRHDQRERAVENGNGRAGALATPLAPPPPPPPAPAPPRSEPPVAPPTPEADPYRPLPPLPAPPEATRPRWPLVAGSAVVLVVLIGLLVTVLGGGGDDAPSDEASGGRGIDTSPTEPEPTTTSAVDVATLPAADAARLATDRLRQAGTFTYQGTSLATDVSPVRPGVWLTVELTHTGEVDLTTGELHDVGVTDDGRATETVTDGTIVWGRLADSVEALADTAYLTIGEPNEVPEPTGALLLPTWLDAASTVEDLPADGSGLRRLRVVVPADVFGEVEGGTEAVDAEITLGLDAAGAPVRVEVRLIGGPPLALTLDLLVGAPVTVDVPTATTDEADGAGTGTDDGTGVDGGDTGTGSDDTDTDTGTGTGTGADQGGGTTTTPDSGDPTT